MRSADVLLLVAGVPLLAAIVIVADRKGLFARDAFRTEPRKRVALALLVGVLSVTVLAPAVGPPVTDTRSLRFHQVFTSQGLVVLFLAAWWILAGRPSLRDFLGLRSARPGPEAAAGVGLGLLGWVLTLMVGIAVAFTMTLFGLAGPRSVSPLVKWIASLSPWKRLAIVGTAMTVEEFQFRGFLQRRLGALPASVLFLLSHGGYGEPLYFVGLVAITAVLAIAFERTGSTIAPILAHGTFDAIQLFLFLPLALRLLEQQ